MVRGDNADDVESTTCCGEQALRLLATFWQIKVFGIEGSNHLYVVFVFAHGEGECGGLSSADVELFGMGQYLAVGHTGACDEHVVAGLEVYSLFKETLVGGILGEGHQL